MMADAPRKTSKKSNTKGGPRRARHTAPKPSPSPASLRESPPDEMGGEDESAKDAATSKGKSRG